MRVLLLILFFLLLPLCNGRGGAGGGGRGGGSSGGGRGASSSGSRGSSSSSSSGSKGSSSSYGSKPSSSGSKPSYSYSAPARPSAIKSPASSPSRSAIGGSAFLGFGAGALAGALTANTINNARAPVRYGTTNYYWERDAAEEDGDAKNSTTVCTRPLSDILDASFANVTFQNGSSPSSFSWTCSTIERCCDWSCCSTTDAQEQRKTTTKSPLSLQSNPTNSTTTANESRTFLGHALPLRTASSAIGAPLTILLILSALFVHA